MIGVKRPSKCALTLHSGVSVMDKVKINEQNYSIATGPYYLHTKFEMTFSTPTQECGSFELHEVLDIVLSVLCVCKMQKYYFT